jgi:hypothetical protein
MLQEGKHWHKVKGCLSDDEHVLTIDSVLNRKIINVIYIDFDVYHHSLFRQIETCIHSNKLRILIQRIMR